MKRMILVPETMVDTIARREEASSTPELDAVVRLGREMDDLRKRTDLSLEQKVRLYQDALRQYLHMKGEIGETKRREPPQPNSRSIENTEVTDTLPRTAREKGRQLVRLLRDTVSWDPQTKEVIINGERVPGSNIQSLIYDAVVPNKRAPPVGSEAFSRALDSAKVPLNLRRGTVRLPVRSLSPKPSRHRRRARSSSNWRNL